MPVPSLIGFLNFLKKRILVSFKGYRWIDKVRLFGWSILDSVPRSLLQTLPTLKEYIERAKNLLLHEVIIKVNESKFTVLDSESVLIISPEFESWIWNHLKVAKGDVFLDVGAHIGKYAVPIAKIVGENGLVIAVEPHPTNYKTLLENIRLNGLKNVIALNIAAWSENRKMTLFIGDKPGHHSAKKDFGRGSIIVKAKALDNVLNELKVERVNWIKIDVEGAEFEVLNGLQNTLRKHRPTLIVEISKEQNKIEDFISKLGYTLEKIAPMYYLLKAS